MLELIGTSFIADEASIIGKPNTEYIHRELTWYLSQSLYVEDIPGTTPTIWNEVADSTGRINSNYGYLMFSEENGYQYYQVLRELQQSPDGRRATAVYTRPFIHEDAVADEMNDFICTNAVNYFIRDKRLNAVVQMRSNDVVYGYPNDLAWQRFMVQMLTAALNGGGESIIAPGRITWQAASLHVYPRHFKLLAEVVDNLPAT